MEMYQTIQNVHRLVSSRIHVGQLWNAETRQCAVKACAHQTGCWVPVAVGRGIQYGLSKSANYWGSIRSTYDGEGSMPQDAIEELLHGRRKYLVVCSTNCLHRVRSLLRLGHAWKTVGVVRGTHLAPPRLLHKFNRIINRYEANYSTAFQAAWGQFNGLIERLDVCMGPQDAETMPCISNGKKSQMMTRQRSSWDR